MTRLPFLRRHLPRMAGGAMTRGLVKRGLCAQERIVSREERTLVAIELKVQIKEQSKSNSHGES